MVHVSLLVEVTIESSFAISKTITRLLPVQLLNVGQIFARKLLSRLSQVATRNIVIAFERHHEMTSLTDESRARVATTPDTRIKH